GFWFTGAPSLFVYNFYFKPRTLVLGSQKTTEQKATPLKKEGRQTMQRTLKTPEAPKEIPAPNPEPVSRSLKKMLDSLPPSVDFAEDKQRELKLRGPVVPQEPFTAPLYQPTVGQPKAPTDFDVTLDNSLSKAFPREEVNKRFFHQLVTPIPQFKEASSSFASAIIDSLVVFGLASLFVVSLVWITQVDIVMMLTNSQLSGRTLVELGLLYAGVNLFYFMLARGLFGSTLGDWAFDVQLGSEEERHHIMYPLQVIFRTFVIMATGLFIVPLVSFAFGKDIAFYFSGLKLYTRQY
ncbi:MAG: hypothetical protein AAF203_10535, partial [Pseudomonadota bacterium]